MRTVLVLLHAVSGVIGLVTGLWAMSPPRPGDGRRRWRQTYMACIGTLIVGLVALVLYDWRDLEAAARIAFSGLAGLAAVMAYRMWRAHREASMREGDWQRRYVSHVYFTYISLWVGVLIVPAVNSSVPQLAVPVVIVAVLAAGHVLITRYQRGLNLRQEKA